MNIPPHPLPFEPPTSVTGTADWSRNGKERPAGIVWAIIGLLLTGGVCLGAGVRFTAPENFALPTTNFAHSVSGQFIVEIKPPSLRAATLPKLANDPNYLELEPALTAITCERIKRALNEMLGASSQWRDRVYVVLNPAHSATAGVTIVAEKLEDGWKYRLEIPNPVEHVRFVRGVVQTLLQEMAGRNASDHTPEIPAWLAEGLTQQLLGMDEGDLLPKSPRIEVHGLSINPTMVDALRRNPLRAARRVLSEHPPLTIAQLSWPGDEPSDGPTRAAYSSSAQLFVAELLRFEDGRACLRAMLNDLAYCYNWQTAFFRAFHAHFERQLDLEKWWALQVVHFTGRNLTQMWSPEESWAKLNEILSIPVEVRSTRNEMPGRGDVSLATVIREWDFVRQTLTLRNTLRELDLLRLRVSQNLIGLVDDYRQELAGYLDKRAHAGTVLPGSKMPSPGANFVVRETLKQLATLEARREELRPQPASASSASTETPVTQGP